jgi:uncharacterized protein (DUF2147 family)
MNISRIIFLLFFTFPAFSNAKGLTGENEILGKWISTHKNVIVNVYKDGKQFKAKVVWFNDSDDPSRPMNVRRDELNSNKALRSQKILGMDILRDLKYNPQTSRWEDGIIYDAHSGKEWSSIVYFNDDGLMEIKGYWKFEFLCKTIAFKRVN